MANKLSVASVIEKNRIASDVAYLALLSIDVPDPTTGAILETLRYVNNTEDVVVQGQTYTAVQFSIELTSASGETPSISLSFADYTQAVLSKMNDYAGGVGFNVKISVYAANNLDGDPEVAEYFQVTAATAANYEVSFTLGAESALTKQFPKRTQRRDFCPWVFKDANTCRYSGSLTSCDHTLDGTLGCRAHANVVNFGGMPALVPSGSIYR
jgi:phage-related protein